MRHILHISDVHFGPPHSAEVAAGVLSLIERRSPDLVVISGDLTQRARREQFVEARRFVDRISVPSLVVPGNHDVPMYRFWERLGNPFGAYRKHFAEDLEPTFEDGELQVIGVNTAYNWTIKDGRVAGRGLRRLATQLQRPGEGRAKIVVAHHQLVPAPRFDTQRVMDNAHNVVDLLAASDVEMVLSGHLHQSWVATTESYFPSGRRPVLLVHSGTTTSRRGRGSERRRNTCNWIRLDDTTIGISNLAWEPSAGAFEERCRYRFPRRNGADYRLETY